MWTLSSVHSHLLLVVVGCPLRVWPLFPVERTWTLNEALGNKIRRKGFTLVPDYASTAFMIQGATLPAAFADWRHRRLRRAF